MRYARGRRNESSPYSPLETFNEDACCRFDHIAVCYCRVRPGFRTCGDRAGSHRSGYDAGACTQDDEARAQGESPRDAQEGGVIIHGLGVKYQNPAAAGFFRIERSVLNLGVVRRLASSRCSRLDWFHSNNAGLMRTRAPCRQGIRGRPVGGAVGGGQARACSESRKNAALCERECFGSSRFASRVKCAPCSDRDSEICVTSLLRKGDTTLPPLSPKNSAEGGPLEF